SDYFRGALSIVRRMPELLSESEITRLLGPHPDTPQDAMVPEGEIVPVEPEPEPAEGIGPSSDLSTPPVTPVDGTAPLADSAEGEIVDAPTAGDPQTDHLLSSIQTADDPAELRALRDAIVEAYGLDSEYIALIDRKLDELAAEPQADLEASIPLLSQGRTATVR